MHFSEILKTMKRLNKVINLHTFIISKYFMFFLFELFFLYSWTFAIKFSRLFRNKMHIIFSTFARVQACNFQSLKTHIKKKSG